ncbi:putative membrane protein [Bradyrhizobium sp. USDA 4011]
MTAAIIYAFASAIFLGAGVVLAQLGLRTVEPLSGAAISVPSFTLLFLVLSPLILHGEPVVWRGLPIFIAIGLFFPASLTLLTFASNRASPLWACLVGYVMSSLVVLTVQRISNGLSALSLFAAVRNGPITLVVPLAAIYPLVTVAMSAMMLKHVEITARIVAGTLLTVIGVALVLIA